MEGGGAPGEGPGERPWPQALLGCGLPTDMLLGCGENAAELLGGSGGPPG
jgi:hypothetical protein